MADPSRTTAHLVMVSVAEAAEEYAIPVATLRRWIAEGSLTAIPVGAAQMVSAEEVAALRHRRIGDLDGGRRLRSATGRRFRAMGATNLVAGLLGGMVFAGIGPAGLRDPWWLGLCLASMVVGLLMLGLVDRPRRSRRVRRDHGRG